MSFKRGSLVSYGGRAAEVLGVQPCAAPSGSSVECLTLAYTAAPRGTVRVPLDRVAATVKSISKREAAILNANVPPAMTRAEQHMAKLRVEKAGKFINVRSLGGKAKAAKHKLEHVA